MGFFSYSGDCLSCLLTLPLQVRDKLYFCRPDIQQEKHAVQVFQYFAGIQGQPAPHLAKLQADIVRQCAGLPLALKLTGTALRGTQSTSDWQVRAASVKAHSWCISVLLRMV
jgi:hypothetical protein